MKQGIGTVAAAVARLRAGGVSWEDSWEIVYGDGTMGRPVCEAVAGFAEKSARQSREIGVHPLVEFAA